VSETLIGSNMGSLTCELSGVC